MNIISEETPEAQPAGGRSPLLPLRPVAGRCASHSCPTVYATSRGDSVVIQGYIVAPSQAGIDVPDGEMLVEIPFDLLTEAMRNLS